MGKTFDLEKAKKALRYEGEAAIRNAEKVLEDPVMQRKLITGEDYYFQVKLEGSAFVRESGRDG